MKNTTTAQTVDQIRAEAAPILASWIERAATHGYDSIANGTLYITRINNRVVAWNLQTAPGSQIGGNWIYAASDRPAKLGNNSDMTRLRDWAVSQFTDRQRESLQTERVA